MVGAASRSTPDNLRNESGTPVKYYPLSIRFTLRMRPQLRVPRAESTY